MSTSSAQLFGAVGSLGGGSMAADHCDLLLLQRSSHLGPQKATDCEVTAGDRWRLAAAAAAAAAVVDGLGIGMEQTQEFSLNTLVGVVFENY